MNLTRSHRAVPFIGGNGVALAVPSAEVTKMKKLLILSGLATVGFVAMRLLRQAKSPIKPVTKDDRIADQVKVEVRLLTTHPDQIAVSARDGRVELKGPILRGEVDHLIKAVRAIPGVERLDDDLEMRDVGEGSFH